MMGREGGIARTMGRLGDGDKDGKGVYTDDINNLISYINY